MYITIEEASIGSEVPFGDRLPKFTGYNVLLWKTARPTPIVIGKVFLHENTNIDELTETLNANL